MRALRILDVGLVAGVGAAAAFGGYGYIKRYQGAPITDRQNDEDTWGGARNPEERELFAAAASGDCERIEARIVVGCPLLTNA